MDHHRITIFGRPVPVTIFGTAIAILSVAYYTLLFTHLGRDSFFGPFPMGRTFNSMLDHLLHGQFDVDPQVIDTEGFIHGGKTYAYFGILPALLRLPLVVLPGWQSIDLTLVSCVLATTLAACFKLCATVAVARRLDATRLRDQMFLALAIASVFGGAQVQFAKVSIYVESVCWANALAAAFVYCAIEGLLSQFSLRRLTLMAILAGLTLLTRVSTSLGLYAALALLVPWLGWSDAADRQRWRALLSGR